MTAKNAVVLGVSFDTVGENLAFAEKFSFPYPLLCDVSRSLGLAYGAADDAGASNAKRIAYIIGPDQRIRKSYAKVDVKGFIEDVLSSL